MTGGGSLAFMAKGVPTVGKPSTPAPPASQKMALPGSVPHSSALYSTNLGLIIKVLSRLKCKVWYRNETITSEWDVLQSIVSSLQEFLLLPSVAHVKGRIKMMYFLMTARLSLEAQLNVDANTVANEYQILYGTSRYKVPWITGNGAQLLSQGKTVTHHYVRKIITPIFSSTTKSTYWNTKPPVVSIDPLSCGLG
jgi:hypothetical protein